MVPAIQTLPLRTSRQAWAWGWGQWRNLAVVPSKASNSLRGQFSPLLVITHPLSGARLFSTRFLLLPSHCPLRSQHPTALLCTVQPRWIPSPPTPGIPCCRTSHRARQNSRPFHELPCLPSLPVSALFKWHTPPRPRPQSQHSATPRSPW